MKPQKKKQAQENTLIGFEVVALLQRSLEVFILR